jgi:NAD(P)-dependent dehydrogenase (short-subunit alcohol dehydrogenase family)
MGADYSSFGLQDKVAIVTGASQGIGRAIALGLATAGAHVVLAKHPEGRHDEVKGVQAEIEALGHAAQLGSLYLIVPGDDGIPVSPNLRLRALAFCRVSIAEAEFSDPDEAIIPEAVLQ